MPLNPTLKKTALRSLSASLGFAPARSLPPPSNFQLLNSKVEAQSGPIQLITNTLVRKRQLLGTDIYTLSFRDTISGKELPLLPLQNTFQKPSLQPHLLLTHDADHATFSSAKGTIDIHFPTFHTEGLADQPIYPGPPHNPRPLIWPLTLRPLPLATDFTLHEIP